MQVEKELAASQPQPSLSMPTIVVGMSGGVDSSVTAALLKRQGFNVVGLFMKNWEDDDASDSECSAAEDYSDVKRVCDKLDIPYYGVNFAKEYWDTVFSQFLKEYEMGFTPNPDILCNREIKFKVFYKKALELGGQFLATGHYCQKITRDGASTLVKGADQDKDQTYFVYTLQKEVLKNVLFPIGGLRKKEVRELAKNLGLATHDKKDSTGICFIGERKFRPFLKQYVSAQPGEFRLLDGTPVGSHQGSAFYTPGQRKGLGLGGQGERWFVVGKDVAKNIVYVERGSEHPALFADELWATEASWVSGEAPPLPFKCMVKTRYRQKDQPCTIVSSENGRLHVVFDHPQRAVSQRQSVVFYVGDICLGGAIIERVGKNYFETKRELPKLHSETYQAPESPAHNADHEHC